jgi:hypothetical protein
MNVDGQIVMSKNHQIVLAAYEAKPIAMHDRKHLEKFKERAEEVGIGLQWPQWRYSIEVGSKIFKEAVERGEVPHYRLQEIYNVYRGGGGAGDEMKVKMETEDGAGHVTTSVTGGTEPVTVGGRTLYLTERGEEKSERVVDTQ